MLSLIIADLVLDAVSLSQRAAGELIRAFLTRTALALVRLLQGTAGAVGRLRQIKAWMEGIMRSIGTQLLIGIVLLSGWSSAPAAITQPPAIQWIAHGDNWIRRSNIDRTISYHRGAQQAEPEWLMHPAGFHAHFSQIFVTADGRRLVHVLSNFQVRTLGDRAVDIYDRDGRAISFPAGCFVDQLQVVEFWQAGEPQYRWQQEASLLESGLLRVTTVMGTRVDLDFNAMLASLPAPLEKQ